MKLKLLALSIPIICASVATGQNGSLDSTYNFNGIVKTATSPGGDDIGNSVLAQSDAKLIIVGSSDDDTDYTLIRYNIDGSLDNTFGTGGIVTQDVNGSLDEGRAAVLQPDGKIIVTGRTGPNWSKTNFTSRHNSNGTLDTSFGTNGFSFVTDKDAVPETVSLQTDGKIVIVADFLGPNDRDQLIWRYNPNGSLDNTFGTNGVTLTDSTYSLWGMSSVIQSDGKIVVGGYTSTSPSDFMVMRYTSNGVLDNSFGINGIVTTDVNSSSIAQAYSVLIQPDGKILLGGWADNGTANYDFCVVRYNTDGSIDNSYGNSGIALIDVNNNSTDYGRAMILLPNGKLVLAGYAHNSGADFALITLLSDGSLDTSFGINGKVFTDIGGSWDKAYSVVLTPNNKIVLGGYSNVNGDDEFTTVRYLTDLSIGIIDLSLKSNSLMIFPNPISNSATLNYKLKNKESLSMDIIDITGKVVKSIFNNLARQEGANQEIIDLSKLSTGTYILRLYNNNQQTNIHIIKN
jgi:uncharacterized delta-60 repeat protein